MALFESYERRIDQITAVLDSYVISSLEEAEKIMLGDRVKNLNHVDFALSRSKKL